MIEDTIDLHTHSTASDGTDTPSEILRKASELRLRAVALTDHDTVAGLSEFLREAEKYALRAVPGVELSTYLKGKEIHIVGLFIQPDNPELLSFLAQQRENRIQRNRAIIKKLQDAGYEITEEDVIRVAGEASPGRPHIGRVLLNKGYFRDMKEVFVKALRRGAPFYVQRIPLSPTEAIRVIKQSGGTAVWAHPVLAATDRSSMRRILKVLIPAGLDAIETYYSAYNEHQHEIALSEAEEFHILQSGGSDYHGNNQPGIALGRGGGNLYVPASLLPELEKRSRNKTGKVM